MKAEKSRGVTNMNDLLLQGEYADIIVELLNEPYNVNSVIKMVFLAFCVRNEAQVSYGKRKNNLIDVLLNNLNIKFLSHPNELSSIFEVLNKMKKCGWITTESGRISVLKEFDKAKTENRFLAGCRGKDINPVVEVNKLDDRAFIEEVLRHV